MTKKIIAFITLVMMLTTFYPASNSISFAAMPQREFVIADFGYGIVPENANISDQNESKCTSMAISDDCAYDGKETSLAWTIGDTTGLLRLPYSDEWESDFDTFNIRVRTETPKQKLNILVNELNTFLSSKDKGYYSDWQKNLTSSEWQTYSVSIDKLKAAFETVPPEYIYISFNCNGWNITSGTKEQFENKEIAGSNNYTVTAIKGEKLYIDSAWLENSKYGKEKMTNPVPSIKNGSAGVEPDLDNNNTYTLTFDETIYEIDNAFKLTMTTPDSTSELVRDSDYEVVIDSNRADIIFSNSLPLPSTVDVEIDSSKIISESAKTLSANLTYSFTIGNQVDFKVLSSYPENGATDIDASSSGFTATVTFNSTLPESGIESFVEVLKGGAKYSDYSLETQDSTLKIIFGSPLDGDKAFTVNIKEGISDIYNNISDESFSFGFTTAKEPFYTESGSFVDDSGSENIKILFTANSESDLDKAIKNSGGVSSVVYTTQGYYGKTFKLTYKAGSTASSAWLKKNDDFTYDGMKYINYRIYQSTPTSMQLNLPLYYKDASGASKNVFKAVAGDWSGWKTITHAIPTTATLYDGLVVNVNGWSQYREEDGFILIDDVWLSTEMPSEVKLVSSSIEDGAKEVNTYANEFEFNFSGNLNSKRMPKINIISADGAESVESEIEVDGKKLIVIPCEFKPATNYVLTISDIYSVQAVEGEEISLGFTTKERALSLSDRNELISLANGTDYEKLADFIYDNNEYFGLVNPGKTLTEDVAKIVISGDSYDDVAVIDSKIADTADKFMKFNSNSERWANVTELIEATPEFFGGEEDLDYKYYTGLKEGKRNEISIEICKDLPADSITELNDAFEDAIENYKDSLKSENKKGSSGGGGGGTGKTTASVVVDEALIPQNTVTPIEKEKVFDDLGGFEWAQESIIALNEAGIISSDANRKFRPADAITREEFAKLLVCAFAPDASEEYHRFTDEEDGAWYSVYLTKAYNSGISTGYPDSSFGIGKTITREDMVTMASRAAELSGAGISSDISGGFSDEALISDYALGYVNGLSGSGIVSGMGDGSFAPKATATRAQAAKIINQLMKLYK